MSGILAVWQSRQPTPWSVMLQDLAVLGGDDQGDWHDPCGLSLGRTQRYNTGQAQQEPPVLHDQGCVLVWTGRLDQREPGCQTTDGQRLITAYRSGGLASLVGDYAFVLWDPGADRLLVSGDLMRRKPLAYFWDGQTLLVSSRVVSLLHHPQVSGALDEDYLAHTFGEWWQQTPGCTPFKAIRRLRLGETLVLQRGQLTRQFRSLTPLDVRYQTPGEYYEAFWEVLGRAVSDRLRHPRPAGVTLSGGLDSTTITAATLKHLPTVDALSFVTEIYPEFDERGPIQTFLDHYPQTRWHPIPSDDTHGFAVPWATLPVPDDPIPVCTTPLHLRAMAQARALGLGTLLDGEWGDEIFRENFPALFRAGAGGLALRLMLGRQQAPAWLWREWVMPRLPQSWQWRWILFKRSQPDPLPPWFYPSYVAQPLVQASYRQSLENSRSQDFQTGLTWGLNQPPQQDILYAAHGLEPLSPFADERLIRFILAIPPQIQIDPQHRKIFLRQATAGYLPEEVRWRPKVNYFDPLRRSGLLSECARELCQQVRDCPPLAEIVDQPRLAQALQELHTQGGLEAHIENSLFLLLDWTNWYLNVKARYPI
ncbi:asparagine synthase-related protein [Candidatus Cyanaurora vandensis]|uniref:asparagine synthase-related protein n=1 Tax=Candidatus Cyanaurora vandensis TaxID=2714958 RepID=UPI00257E9958|nr:asparagine synthase-related protein [Candidatus Cyanaurora vandensis]